MSKAATEESMWVDRLVARFPRITTAFLVLIIGSGGILMLGRVLEAVDLNAARQAQVKVTKTVTCAIGGHEHSYGVVTNIDTKQSLITFKDSAGVSYEAPRSACIIATTRT